MKSFPLSGELVSFGMITVCLIGIIELVSANGIMDGEESTTFLFINTPTKNSNPELSVLLP